MSFPSEKVSRVDLLFSWQGSHRSFSSQGSFFFFFGYVDLPLMQTSCCGQSLGLRLRIASVKGLIKVEALEMKANVWRTDTTTNRNDTVILFVSC